MNELGAKEVGTSVQQPLPLTYNDWWKSVDKNAPQEYNEAILAEVEKYSEIGKINPFSHLRSAAWVDTWPRYQNEWESRVVQTIVGDITMEQFKEYIEGLRNTPELKKAFQEFKQAYDDFQNN